MVDESTQEPQPILIGIEVESLEGRRVLSDILEEVRSFFPILAISSVFKSIEVVQGRNAEKEKLVLVVKSETDSISSDVCTKVYSVEKHIHQKHPLRYVRIILLAQGSEVAMSPNLVLPHPDLIQSEGILAAASELWGRYRHPVLQSSLDEIAIKVGKGKAEFVFQGKTLLTETKKVSLFNT